MMVQVAIAKLWIALSTSLMLGLASLSMDSTMAASMIMLRYWSLDTMLATWLGTSLLPFFLSHLSHRLVRRNMSRSSEQPSIIFYQTRSHTWSHVHLTQATYEQIHLQLELLENVSLIQLFFLFSSSFLSLWFSSLHTHSNDHKLKLSFGRLWSWSWVSSRCTSGHPMVCFFMHQIHSMSLEKLKLYLDVVGWIDKKTSQRRIQWLSGKQSMFHS